MSEESAGKATEEGAAGPPLSEIGGPSEDTSGTVDEIVPAGPEGASSAPSESASAGPDEATDSADVAAVEVSAPEENAEPEEAADEAPATAPAVETAQAPAVETAQAPVTDEAPETAADEAAVESPETVDQVAPREPTTPREKAIAALFQACQDKTPVDGRVIGWNKGGFHVSLDGVGAFCPRSQIEIGNPRNPQVYMDQDTPFLILEMDEAGRRIVVSRRDLLAEERSSQRQALKEQLQPGVVLSGRIDSLSDFGAFVDLGGGIRGLVHVSELSRRRVERPEEAVNVGQEIEVKVLKVEKGGKRISLSRRELEPDPWIGIEDRLQRASEFEGTVVRHTDFGIFVEVEPGIEGLLHTSQLPIGSSADDASFAAGQSITGWVREADAGRNRLSLTMREVPEGDPWDGVETRYEEGSVVEGQVEQVSRFGFFVALEPGLTGLLPFSAVTAPSGRRREDAYRVGQKLIVSIMELDRRRHRISLGLEGAKTEGSKADFHAYKKKQAHDGGGLNAMAAAFEKLKQG